MVAKITELLEIDRELKSLNDMEGYHFVVDPFEEMILKDLGLENMNVLRKLKRNVTNKLKEWIYTKIDQKEPVKINLKGGTRCIFENTNILLSNFSIKTIKECRINDKIFCLNEETNKIEIKPILEIYNNGKKECYEVTLRGNKKIIITNNHPLLKLINKNTFKKKWLQLKDLKEGDYIACPRKIPFYKKTKYELNEIELIGFWLGDGYMKNNNSKNSKTVIFDLSKKDKINYLQNLVKNTKLNYKINRYEYKHKENFNWNNGNKFTFSKKIQNKGLNNTNRYKDDFSQIIYNLNLNNCLAKDKFIPNIFKLGTQKELYSLLSGLINSDGSIDKTKGINYSSCSKILIEDIKIILTKLGIYFYDKIKTSNLRGKNYKSYVLYISKVNDCKKIFDNCNLIKNKRNKLQTFINSKNLKYSNKKHNIEYKHISFYKIKTIKKIGYKQTYDLTIKDNHNFISELIFTHNTGKSLGGLRIVQIIDKKYEREFDPERSVCGNQGEYMQKLQNVEFGEVLQMDEKLFGQVGEGSYALEFQMQNTDNVTAKYNIHSISITPKRFISNNASIGLATWGRDINKWASRYILYDLRGAMPTLLGYVIIDIKPLFEDKGCKIYKKCGGCPNPKRYGKDFKAKDLVKEFHRKISEDEQKQIINTGRSCPFYTFCELPMAKYEKKKDSWIEDELKGGLSSRKKEVLRAALKLIPFVCYYEKGSDKIKFNTHNKKETKEMCELFMGEVTNMKWTITELDSVLTNLHMAITQPKTLDLLIKQSELNKEELLEKIEIREPKE